MLYGYRDTVRLPDSFLMQSFAIKEGALMESKRSSLIKELSKFPFFDKIKNFMHNIFFRKTYKTYGLLKIEAIGMKSNKKDIFR